jgi:hypothetical protein
LAVGLWDVEVACTIMAEDIFSRGVARRAGYANSEWGIELKNTPTGTFMSALLWSDRNDIIADLENSLANFVDTEIAVVDRYA